jgi:hypothetical protein
LTRGRAANQGPGNQLTIKAEGHIYYSYDNLLLIFDQQPHCHDLGKTYTLSSEVVIIPFFETMNVSSQPWRATTEYRTLTGFSDPGASS